MGKIGKVLLSTMVVLALLVSVFNFDGMFNFFGVSSSVFSLVENISMTLYELVPDELQKKDDSIIPFDEFYLMRYRFGENKEYYCDFALPDPNSATPFYQDYWLIYSNYSDDVYIRESVITGELDCLSEKDGLLFIYFNLVPHKIYFMTKEEYVINYYKKDGELPTS